MRASPGSRRIIDGSPRSRGGTSAREVHRLGDLDFGNVPSPIHQGADPRDCKDVSPAAPAGENIPLKVVFEDAHLLVVDKPADFKKVFEQAMASELPVVIDCRTEFASQAPMPWVPV